MIQLKSKVIHPVYGVGIVVNLKNNDSLAHVDFKGELHWCEVSFLTKGANEYRPVKSGDAIMKYVQTEILNLKNEFGNGQFAEGGKTACDKLLKRLGL